MCLFKKLLIAFKAILFLFSFNYAICQNEIPSNQLHTNYPWLKTDFSNFQTLQDIIPPPNGFSRTRTSNNELAEWYRNLPMKPAGSKVVLYNKELKYRQDVHEAIVDIDIGKRDLQQCADAIIRLRAEYLYSKKRYEQIHFNFTNGQEISYSKWRSGYKIQLKNNKAVWFKTHTQQNDYYSFKKYLNLIFAYSGTYSLSKELKSVKSIGDLKIGDVFIQGGFPGHAVVVVDMVENNKNDKYFLLAQSFMPAQNIHIVKNFSNSLSSPWYSLQDLIDNDILRTPEWTFQSKDLKRFN